MGDQELSAADSASTMSPIATESPVSSVELPVQATSTSEVPVDATQDPASSSEIPVVATQAPVSSSDVPVEATRARTSSLEVPVEESQAPVSSPNVPVEATLAPLDKESGSVATEMTPEIAEPFEEPMSEKPGQPSDPYNSSLLPGATKTAAGFDPEENVQKLKYPKSVFFIIVNEFCERFSFYGLRTLLAIYMTTILKFSDDTATVVYHAFVMLCYFFPVFGAIIADSLLGKFKTIIYLSVVFAIGNIILTIASMDEAIGVPATEISMLGLFLIAIGTGGIKPCVAAFGGDQFVVPQQQLQLERFFSIYYFTINSGSFISTFLTPILREDVKCFDVDSCYPLAFGVPAILMITSIVVFLLGKSFYVMKKPSGNIIMEIFGIIWHALRTKRKSTEKKEHWLDHAEDKFGKKSVHDIKLLLRVLFLYLPLPIFWALYDQQGSRWTFQATRMNGDIGGWSIKPEQLQVVNPLLILAFVPLFDFVIYPLLGKCHLLTKPLHRLGAGGVMAGLAFIISAFVELSLEPTYAMVPKAGNGQLRFYNGFNCPVVLTSQLSGDNNNADHIIEALGLWELKDLPVTGSNLKTIKVNMNDTSCGTLLAQNVGVTLYEKKATSHLITKDGDKVTVKGNMKDDDVDKTKNGFPKIRIIYNFIDPNIDKILTLTGSGGNFDINLNSTEVGTDYVPVPKSSYMVKVDDSDVVSIDLEVGGVYSLLISEISAGQYELNYHEITSPNSVHMLWLMPQYFVMTAGEVMYSVTGVQFSFTQAPVSMKAVIQAAWLITIAVGNLIVVIIAEAKIFDRQIFEFILFAVLMFIDMLIFAAMAWNYKYIDLKEEEELNQMKMAPVNGVDNDAFAGERL